jgi:hypothetical protein
LGILGIENRKPNIFFLSFPAGNYQIIYLFIYLFIFECPHHVHADADASAHPRRASEEVWGGG